MGCFFTCFRVKNCERQKTHLVSKSIASKNRDLLVTKNQLASVFQCEEKGSPSERVRHLSLQQNFDKESSDEELKDEVKFLKSCGALLETPIEIRKISEKTNVQTPGIDHVPPNFHSRLPDTSCRKLHWDEQPKQFSYTATEDHENSVLPESKPGSCCSEEHRGQRKIVRFDEGVEHISGNELVGSHNLNISPQTKNQIQQLGSDDSPYPTPVSLSEDMNTPGTIYTPKSTGNNGRIRSQYVFPVLNHVQNLSQWKTPGERAMLSQSSDQFEQGTGSSTQDGDRSEQTSPALLSTDLSLHNERGQDQHTVFKQEADFNQETPKLVVSSLSQWLKPPVPIEERWKTKNITRSPSDKSSDAERPIIGMVAAHWNENEPSHISPKWFDGNGIPNSTNKYKEDQKVSWHATPFEERLEKDLSDEKLFPRRELTGRAVNLDDEGEESDTAAS